jgi:hypothetical protein
MSWFRHTVTNISHVENDVPRDNVLLVLLAWLSPLRGTFMAIGKCLVPADVSGRAVFKLAV